MIRDVFPKKKSKEWFKKQRSIRQKMMLTRTALKQRTDLRTTAIHSRDPSPPQKLKERSQQMTRKSLRMPSKKPFNGLTPILPLKRKNSKKSKSHLRELQCQFFNPWLAQPEEHQEVCQEQEECQTSEVQHQEEHHQLTIQHLDQLLKKLIKRFEEYIVGMVKPVL